MSEFECEIDDPIYEEDSEQLSIEETVRLSKALAVDKNFCNISSFKKAISVNNKFFFIPRDRFLKKLDPDIFDINIIRIFEDWNLPGGLLAGGKIVDLLNKTNNSSSDFDIFFVEKKDYYFAINFFKEKITEENEMKFINPFESCDFTHISFKDNNDNTIKVQLIYAKDKLSFDEVLNSFDFRCCSIGYDGNNLIAHKGAFKDIKNKILILKALSGSQNLHNRVMKYSKKGFTISRIDFYYVAINHILSFQSSFNQYLIHKPI